MNTKYTKIYLETCGFKCRQLAESMADKCHVLKHIQPIGHVMLFHFYKIDCLQMQSAKLRLP